MKIPNYDPVLKELGSDYIQGHPCMPADVFRMLICGPSSSGKINILLHMLYELLAYDKVYLFSKKPASTQIPGPFARLWKKNQSRSGI